MNKICTTIEQSKKLVELGIDINTADIWWNCRGAICAPLMYCEYPTCEKRTEKDIPAWSIAALLSVLPKGTDIVKEEADTENERYMCTVGAKDDIISTFGNNPVDACYEMIIKLHDQGLL